MNFKPQEKLFSIKNDDRKIHKVITVLGAKVKIRKDLIKKIKEQTVNYKIMHDPSLYVGVPDDITLQLMFNNDCNCKCKFCSANNQSKQKREIIPQEWLYEAFKPIYPKVKNLVPTYGEITYGKEGYEYLNWICENYPHINIFIETNGIAFNEKWQKMAADNLFNVNFSVNAIDEESFIKTVWEKEGIFPVIKKNIENYLNYLKQNDLFMFKPSVSFVLNSTNYHLVENMIKMSLNWGLQKLIFFFDTRENSLKNLSVKDREHFDKALYTLIELEKILKEKVQLGYRLFMPINNIKDYDEEVSKKSVEELQNKYAEIYDIAKDFSLYGNYELKKNKYVEKNKKIWTYYEELTSPCYHQFNYKNKIICENAYNHLRLRPNGEMDICPWRGYKNKIQNYIKNNKLNAEKLFNDLYHRKLRKNFQNKCYSGCMNNCPGASNIELDKFNKIFHIER